MSGEIEATNLESIGDSGRLRGKRAKKRMGQNSSQFMKDLVSSTADKLTFGPQRRAVSDWISQKEDQVKGAYQRAKTALQGPTRYDYTKSKFKVSSPQKTRTVAAKTTTARKRTSGKTAKGY